MEQKKPLAGAVKWECPSNIALIKYWGKRKDQLPMNPSLSLTLNNAVTQTFLNYEWNLAIKGPLVNYTFSGKANLVFEKRIAEYMNNLVSFMPFLRHCMLTIHSENTFPHSSGIASSASAFGALALAIVEAEMQVTGKTYTNEEFKRKASFIARLGSGSACRSVYGGVVVWGNTDDSPYYSNDYAVTVQEPIDEVFLTMCDTILLIDSSVKRVSSSTGHQLMEKNPYSGVRFKQARKNLTILMAAMQKGDMEQFVDIVEYEALSLHAMMMTSYPGYVLLQPSSLEAIERIRRFRTENNVPVCFTVDAGANIHILYPVEYKEKITTELVIAQLQQLCTEGKYMDDMIGTGPRKLLEE